MADILAITEKENLFENYKNVTIRKSIKEKDGEDGTVSWEEVYGRGEGHVGWKETKDPLCSPVKQTNQKKSGEKRQVILEVVVRKR